MPWWTAIMLTFPGNACPGQGCPEPVLSSNGGSVKARSSEIKALGAPMGEFCARVWPFARHHGREVFSPNSALKGPGVPVWPWIALIIHRTGRSGARYDHRNKIMGRPGRRIAHRLHHQLGRTGGEE